jgi:hypothetical protein
LNVIRGLIKEIENTIVALLPQNGTSTVSACSGSADQTEKKLETLISTGQHTGVVY